jgi:hypothetical protein
MVLLWLYVNRDDYRPNSHAPGCMTTNTGSFKTFIPEYSHLLDDVIRVHRRLARIGLAVHVAVSVSVIAILHKSLSTMSHILAYIVTAVSLGSWIAHGMDPVFRQPDGTL